MPAKREGFQTEDWLHASPRTLTTSGSIKYNTNGHDCFKTSSIIKYMCTKHLRYTRRSQFYTNIVVRGTLQVISKIKLISDFKKALFKRVRVLGLLVVIYQKSEMAFARNYVSSNFRNPDFFSETSFFSNILNLI